MSEVSDMVTQDRLKELFDYAPQTGDFIRILAVSSAKAGDVAGTIQGKGYLGFNIDNRHYLAHRLAWLYMYGEWPKHQIDHIDGNKTNNRIENLRDVDNSENHRNTKVNSNSTTGILGVCWCSEANKWRAYIHIGGRQKRLGSFDDIADAAKARAEAEKKYGFHPNHGKRLSTTHKGK
jgi:hypothetical protein